jgi:hypothetical protein
MATAKFFHEPSFTNLPHPMNNHGLMSGVFLPVLQNIKGKPFHTTNYTSFIGKKQDAWVFSLEKSICTHTFSLEKTFKLKLFHWQKLVNCFFLT